MVLLVVAAVSGTGKSTLARHLIERHATLRLSVSHTTRAPRPGEVDGVHYHFVTRDAFERAIAAGEFLEWAEYAGNLYGTARSEIEAARRDGHDLLFDVDVVGAANLKRADPATVTCFILPPSWEVLEERLRRRGTETEASIARRLGVARRELEAARTFDYLVVNDTLEAAVTDLDHIYCAARLRTAERGALLERLGAPRR